ncbi:NUDIX domain-containing protein [Microbacterium sp. T32]|uniref:NUDIX domain-containing protein n=1 Tax=Microbacterium sp. T32 TaxID=1776083 RepID=UPI0007ABE772|nr:NUDIX domain-containing protein [Microbacterium sp. T32]KZE39574.1 DNA mismatch repair protein MutT [Microbacterium sp. T32]
MVAWSAGLLLYRRHPALEVLIAHMGGPFWARKDAGAWSIPKGEFDPAIEEPRDAAHREFVEELGLEPPAGEWVELGTLAAASSKKLVVFALDGTGFEASGFSFGEFEMEWPPRSGRTASFPEVDRAEWRDLDAAREALVKGQRPALDALERLLA